MRDIREARSCSRSTGAGIGEHGTGEIPADEGDVANF